VYETGVKEAIHALKYKNNLAVGSLFVSNLVSIIRKERWNLDAIVPIPLSRTRLKERGYNQAAILAYPISLHMKIPLVQNMIARTKSTESQVHLNHSERRNNLANAFSVNRFRGKYKRVLIVDDVITTGSTINDCARALLESGVEEVYGISVARSVLSDMET
jgi:ComF family protein